MGNGRSEKEQAVATGKTMATAIRQRMRLSDAINRFSTFGATSMLFERGRVGIVLVVSFSVNVMSYWRVRG